MLMDIVRKTIANNKYYNNDVYSNTKTIEDLPIIDKKIVSENYKRIFNKKKKRLIFTETSGSSGMTLRIPWEQDEYVCSMASLWRLRKKHDISPKDFYLTCHACVYADDKLIENPVIVSSNFLSLSKLQNSADILKLYLQNIKLFSPKWIYAQPSFVYCLGSYIKENDPSIANMFTYVELVGESLPSEMCQAIKALFPRAQVVNMYGMQEFNGIFYEGEEGLQLISDNVYVEILRDDGSSCNDDEEGRIVVTGLKNSIFPLVRYDTGDRGKKTLVNNHVIYEITVGRSNDEFSHNGMRYDGSLFFIIINEYNKRHSADILKFQVVFDRNQLTFKIFGVKDLPPLTVIEKDLANIFYEMTALTLPVKVQIMENSFPLVHNNKIKYFINKNTN